MPHLGNSCRLPGERSSYRPIVEMLEDRVAPAGTGTGLLGHYYSDPTLTNLASVRVDPSINFNWSGGKAPLSGVAATNFSVRWVGQLEALVSEPTTIYTRSDDGVRLKLDGKVVIDAWDAHPVREDRTIRLNLVAGQRYTIELEYYQHTGDAVVQLFWRSTTIPWSLIPTSQLYPPETSTSTSEPPTASLRVSGQPTVGATTFRFTVTYASTVPLDLNSLDHNDLQVRGPNGFLQPASFEGVVSSTATTWSVAYRMTAPGGTWDRSDNGWYAVVLQNNQVRNTDGAWALGRSLGTFLVNLTEADWFGQHLLDANLSQLVRGLATDQELSRDDMLAIFAAVEPGGVTATEWNDLRTLVAHAATLGMPDHVRNLANKVVNGNPANQRYQGQPLGNLMVGSSGQHLRLLVDKWFRGSDRPALTTTSLTYTLAVGTLFGSGPTYTDVRQGLLSNCSFVAALSSIALRSPQTIRQAFIDNGDGTFTVRFFNNGVPDYVTVDRYLPVDAQGRLYYASRGASAADANAKLWVALFEKAYAQLAESGWSRSPTSANAYEAIRIGWEGHVIRHITGQTASSGTLYDSSLTLNTLVTAFQTGKQVLLNTKSVTAVGIVANHVYVVVGYQATTQTFNLWNVWGYHQQLTWTQIIGSFSNYTLTL